LGPTLLWLEAQEQRWILRRIEQIELLEPSLARRTEILLLRLPRDRHRSLRLAITELDDREGQPNCQSPVDDDAEAMVVVPLGRVPHRALRRAELSEPQAAYVVPGTATRRIVLSGLREWARTATSDEELKRSTRAIAQLVFATDTRARHDALCELEKRLPGKDDRDTTQRGYHAALRQAAAGFPLLAAVPTKAEQTVAVSVAYDEPLEGSAITARASLGLRPVLFRLDLPGAAHRRPSLHAELVSAPDGMRATRLEILGPDASGKPTSIASDPVLTSSPSAHGTTHVAANDRRRPTDPDRTVVEIDLELIPEELAVPAGISSGLTVAALWTGWATAEILSPGAGSALLAGPALLNSLISGFKGSRIASSTARLLRLCVLFIALCGIAGAIVIAATDNKKGVVENLAYRDDWILVFAVLASFAATVPLLAALRALGVPIEPPLGPE
jgi:hypothetical protein